MGSRQHPVQCLHWQLLDVLSNDWGLPNVHRWSWMASVAHEDGVRQLLRELAEGRCVQVCLCLFFVGRLCVRIAR